MYLEKLHLELSSYIANCVTTLRSGIRKSL